jgi:hypothetical protein
MKKMDVEYIEEQVKMAKKRGWRSAGYGNREFSAPPILKPMILTNWQQLWVDMTERSYKYPKDFKGFHFTPGGHEFIHPDPKRDYSENFKLYLTRQ